MERALNKLPGKSVAYFKTFNIMHPLFYYVIFSYPIIAGILWESKGKDSLPQLFIWVLSPIFLPIYLGMFISKHYNK